jgi:hypothetical protein
MNWARWERYAPLAGVAAAVLWIVGTIVIESTDFSSKDTPEEILAVTQDDSATIITGGVIFALGVVLFVWFLGSLRARFLLAEGGLGRLTSLVYGSGLLVALCLTMQVAPPVIAASADEDLSADAAQALQTMGEAFFAGTWVLLVPMLVAAGLVIMRTRALPVWLGWASLVLALGLLIPPVGWLIVLFLFPVWTLVASVLVFVRPPPPPGPPPHTATFVGTG